MAYNANKAINGTFGRLWINDRDMAQVVSFEAKANLNYEEVNMADDLGTHQKYMGYSIEGTVTLNKIDSSIADIVAEGIQTGAMPEINIVARLADPAAKGAERVKLYGVTFDELTLLRFEQKTLTTDEVPFKAESFEYLDMIS